METREPMRDFFISHATADRHWAEWITVTLECEGYKVYSQSFDIRPASNFVHRMQTFITNSERIIPLLSPAYLESRYGRAEWYSKFAEDPLGQHGLILPIIVEPCERPGLLKPFVYVDVTDVDENGARAKLLAAVDRNRPRRKSAAFPGTASKSSMERAGERNALFPGTAHGSTFLNHESTRSQLREVLALGRPGVVVVQGPAGVGKSSLVNEVLSDLPGGSSGDGQVPIHRHPLAPGARLTVRTLIDDIEGSAEISARRQAKQLSLGRLGVALEALRNSPIVIVIDSAEQLLESGTGHMIDIDLDEALEILSTMPDHRVTVVLITQTTPVSHVRNTWPSTASSVKVGGLPIDYFAEYVKRLEGGQHERALSENEVARLHGLLDGNPRLAEIAKAIVAWPDCEITAETLVDRLSRLPARDIPRFLVELMCQGLPSAARRVLEALAAFGTPIDMDAVGELVAPEVSLTRAEAWLETLCRGSIIRITLDRRYYIPQSDVGMVLRSIPGGQEGLDRLLSRAAYVLSQRRTADAEIRTLADLDIHFAELWTRLRARSYRSAYELVEQMDEILRPWNCGGLLAHARETLRTHLGDDFLELANYNALGDIYVSRGMFDLATDAYDKALRHEPASEESNARRKIFANMATMLFEQNLTEQAQVKYGWVLGMAKEHDDLGDEMAALEGLADCHRRWGRYEEAIALAVKALSAAHAVGSDRAVDIALKLARWYNEIGRIGDANRLLDAAQQEAAEHASAALSACCLEGRADFLLGRGQIDLAMEAAEQAIQLALRHHDPVTLRQARTTLCLAHLKTGDRVEASREIDAALRYRRKGKSLEVLALGGLVALGRTDYGRARELFSELCEEAREQRTHDSRDFAALEFYSIGVCGLSVVDNSPAQEAVTAIRAARDLVGLPVPGLASRLQFMIEYLGRFSDGPEQFRPVIDALSGPMSHQQSAKPPVGPPHWTGAIPAPAPG